MPATVRKGDVCTGHGCFPSRSNSQGSVNSFGNNKGVHTVGMGWNAHGCAICPPHGASQASGSPDTFEGGKPVARVGDGISCGSSNSSGSPDIITN